MLPFWLARVTPGFFYCPFLGRINDFCSGLINLYVLAEKMAETGYLIKIKFLVKIVKIFLVIKKIIVPLQT